MEMKLLSLSETKLFHFHGIFKKNEIKSEKRTLCLYKYEHPYPVPHIVQCKHDL